MFYGMSLKMKVMGLSAIFAIFVLAVGVAGYLSSREMADTYHHVATHTMADVQKIGSMEAHFYEIRVHLRTLGIDGLSAEGKKKATDEAKNVIAEYEALAKDFESEQFEPGEKQVYDGVASSWSEFKTLGAKIVALAQSNGEEDRRLLKQAIVIECPAIAEKYAAAMDRLMEQQTDSAKAWVAKAEGIERRATWMMIAISVGSIFVSLLLGFLFSSGLARSLDLLSTSLMSGANEVSRAARQIADSGSDLSASTTEQAAALQETVASVDEVSAMVSKNAENAKRSQETSELSRVAATRGKTAVEEMLQSMDEISASNTEIVQQTETSNVEIGNIVKVIAEIGNKTKVINDIVFQTKLLSFNASVEAARAGEHGKGFAVVAEEVGNLAQMSGNAAKEISQLLDDSIRRVESTVQSNRARVEKIIVSGREKVESGIETARRCGVVLDEVVKNIESLNSMVSEISVASQEQAQGVQEINKAMGQLDQVTQQNAASSQQSAESSQKLNEQADSMRSLVGDLLKTVRGAGHEGNGAIVDDSAMKRSAKEMKTNAKTPARIVSISSKSSKPAAKTVVIRSRGSEQKSVAGSDIVPSGNDPRFEDV